MTDKTELSKEAVELLKFIAVKPRVWSGQKQTWIDPDSVKVDPDFIAAGVSGLPGEWITPEMKAMYAKLPVPEEDYPAWEAEMRLYYDTAKYDYLFSLKANVNPRTARDD